MIWDLRAVGERWHPSKVTGVRVISITVIVIVVRIRPHCDVIRRSVAPAETRLSVSHKHRDGYSARRQWVTSQLQALILPLPLALVPPVLKPDLDLCGGELKHGGELLSFRCGQVALLLKTPLQLKHLSLGEEHTRFPARARFWPVSWGFFQFAVRAARVFQFACTCSGIKLVSVCLRCKLLNLHALSNRKHVE